MKHLSTTFSGFLSLDDSNAPGNYGLLDIVAALHWVKENVHAFGGDPNEVTLLGQGHGGTLVNILLVSPVTKGTDGSFNRKIYVVLFCTFHEHQI